MFFFITNGLIYYHKQVFPYDCLKSYLIGNDVVTNIYYRCVSSSWQSHGLPSTC